MRIGLLHYSMPPSIGGVEQVIAAHIELFQADGHAVVLFSQEITPGFSNVGLLEENRDSMFQYIVSRKLDLLIVHNVFTMPFCPAATAACHRLAATSFPLIAWVHDIAATNPYYAIAEDDLIRQHPAGAKVVAISEERAAAYQALTGFSPVGVVPNGVDTLTGWTGALRGLKESMRGAFPILFHPTRILRRKNIGLGVQVTAELKKIGLNPRLLISGASENFSGDQAIYRASLDTTVLDLDVSSEVFFLGDSLALNRDEITQLYQLSDGLFFPSEHEGFGLPVLEAALHRLPLFISDNQPLAELAVENGFVFSATAQPADLACRILDFLERSAGSHVRQCVRRDFDWQGVYQKHILPLINPFIP